MGERDVGIAAADVGHHNAILVRELGKEIVRGVRVTWLIGFVCRIENLRMARTVDRLALLTVMDVAVAADGSVRAPFVARDADELFRNVEFPRQFIQLTPESAGDLEIITLMPHHIEKCLVATKLEIFSGGIGAERLVGLAVCITPEMDIRCPGCDDFERIGGAE